MYILNLKKQLKVQNRRTFFLFSGKLALLSLVGWRLFNLQILDSNKYKTLSKNNQIRIKIIYPLRGNILDRNNIVIATNKKSYDLYIIPEQTPDVNMTLNKLSSYIEVDFEKKRKVIGLFKKVRKFERIKILNNIDWKDLEIIEANKIYLQGLYLENSPQRIYPFDNYYSHILGYVNKPSDNQISLPYVNKMPSLDIGRTGLEKFFNEELVGQYGKREVEINAIGREIRQISIDNSTRGKNVNISIDSRIQKFIHEELKIYKAGSIVVIKVKSGEILGMTSNPSYNPNAIVKKPNEKYWNTIIDNSLSPLTNRSIQGLYSPGSTFKMMVALAGLSLGVLNTKDYEICKGKIEFGDRTYHCWKTKGHGEMNLANAIKQSCDVFFYELSKKVGIDNIAKVAKDFGLGQIYNFGFENEKKGIIPNKKWKKNYKNENWVAGETLNSAIGQGYVLTTPLQLAVMTARIASNGQKIKPSILKKDQKIKFDKVSISKNNINIIKDSMFKVVNEKKGTAFKHKSKNFNFSGKTGTSQVKKITMEERESVDFRKKEQEWKNRDHALFVGYMPSNNPKFAVSVVIEHGGSGASTAAPIAKNIFEYLHKLKI